MNPNLDNYNYVSINNPKLRHLALQILETYKLTDIFRYIHPDTKRYTWRRKNCVKQARSDYFIVSSSFTDIVTSCKINSGYRSDHSILELNAKINSFQWGKGLWKFNCSLLKDETYIAMINEGMKNIKIEYVVLVLPINISMLIMIGTFDDNLLLEMLLLKIRGITITYSSLLKKAEAIQDKTLLKDIDIIESSNSTHVLLDTLEAKKRNY